MCHHLDQESLADFIIKACDVARRRVIINDLHRNILAYYLFKMIAPILFPNRLVLHDGPLSVLRAFKYAEWIDCLTELGLNPKQFKITWHWAFRWIVEINCKGYSMIEDCVIVGGGVAGLSAANQFGRRRNASINH